MTLTRRRSLQLAGLFAGHLLRGVAAGAVRRPAVPAVARFVVYYGLADLPALSACNVLVLDSEFDPVALRRLAPGRLLLGYLSLGEVHTSRPYAAELERRGLLLDRNARWSDARMIDLRHPAWKQQVLEELAPAILERGFHGLFLDTLDDAEFLQTADPVRHAGMVAAAAELVAALRRRFVTAPLMINRGYAFLQRIIDDIDMLLGESVRSTWDAALQTYVRLSAEAVRWQRDRLLAARRARPALRLFSLDYWDATDRAAIARLYAEAEADGFVPYVSTIDLGSVVSRP